MSGFPLQQKKKTSTRVSSLDQANTLLRGETSNDSLQSRPVAHSMSYIKVGLARSTEYISPQEYTTLQTLPAKTLRAFRTLHNQKECPLYSKKHETITMFANTVDTYIPLKRYGNKRNRQGSFPLSSRTCLTIHNPLRCASFQVSKKESRRLALGIASHTSRRVLPVAYNITKTKTL